jgi:hypothetical protein
MPALALDPLSQHRTLFLKDLRPHKHGIAARYIIAIIVIRQH